MRIDSSLRLVKGNKLLKALISTILLRLHYNLQTLLNKIL